MKDTFYDVKFIIGKLSPLILNELEINYNVEADTIKEAIKQLNADDREEALVLIKDMIREYTHIYISSNYERDK